MTLTNANQRAMRELIHRYKHGLEATIRMTTKLWDIRVVFEGTRAYTEGRTIALPNVDIFALNPDLTNEAVEEARAYFTALVGYAWREVGTIVESDARLSTNFAEKHGTLANVIRSVLDEIRCEHRFSVRGQGIAEAIEYVREQWAWPRVARQIAANQDGGVPDLVHEVLHGLQCVMKHQDYDNHQLWRALSLEAQTFVERNLDDLEAAHDTLKMDAVDSASRLGEIVVRMLARWKAEWEAVAPLAVKLEAPEAPKEMGERGESDGLDTVKGEEALRTSDGLSPFLLVTYGPRPLTLRTIPFNGGYVRRVENVPSTKEEWEALVPLHPATEWIRTLVVLPPDPKDERALGEAMAELMRGLMSISKEMEEQAEQELQNAQHQLEQLPEDQKPYLVYTTANDQFVTTPDAPLSRYKELQDSVLQHVGTLKRRLQTLLRIRTKDKWRRNQPEGDELDQGAMADIAISPMTPQATLLPFRIKFEKDTLLNTTVGLLTDVSGSMGCGEGSKLELARWASLCFAEALDLAKIKFGVWAFTSADHHAHGAMAELIDQCRSQNLTQDEIEAKINLYGRFGALHIETIKSFTDRWLSTQQRLPAMGSMQRANYDADSVQWAAQQLLNQKAKRRVLFVLSDGLPDTGEGRIQVARQRRHLSDVVRAMIAQNVEVVGVGICDASVRLYYPHHVVIHRSDDLPKVVLNEMDHLLLRSRR